MLSFRKIASIGLCLAVFGGCKRQETPLVIFDVKSLLRDYPVVHYQGKKEPPLITIEKKRPSYWVDLGSISKITRSAILLSEDGSFYKHNGFDTEAIKDAIEKNWQAKRFVRGGSTITQQVAKNIFLSRERSLWRKAKEAALTVALEKELSKKRILEIYFNVVEWGEGIFGIRQASRYYFSKEPADLNPKEAAFLAMLLPSPKRYSASYHKGKLTPFAQRAIRKILRKMKQAGDLSADQFEEQMGTPLSFERSSSAELSPLPSSRQM